MARAVYCSLLGAILGGLILAMVASFGAEAAVMVPMAQANGMVTNEAISVAGIVSKLAIIFKVCTGAARISFAGSWDNIGVAP